MCQNPQFVSSPTDLVRLLNDGAAYNKIGLKFSLTAKNFVRITKSDANIEQIYVHDSLRNKIGFDNEMHSEKQVTGIHDCNVWRGGYDCVNLYAPNLCESLVCGKTLKPLLRSFAIPINQSDTFRFTLDFSQKEWWLPLSVSQLTYIDFHFTKATSDLPLSFSSDTGRCVLSLCF